MEKPFRHWEYKEHREMIIFLERDRHSCIFKVALSDSSPGFLNVFQGLFWTLVAFSLFAYFLLFVYFYTGPERRICPWRWSTYCLLKPHHMTQYHSKMCNKQTGPLCPFDALPLQTVKWTHMLKLQARGDDIFKARKSVVSKKKIKCIPGSLIIRIDYAMRLTCMHM